MKLLLILFLCVSLTTCVDIEVREQPVTSNPESFPDSDPVIPDELLDKEFINNGLQEFESQAKSGSGLKTLFNPLLEYLINIKQDNDLLSYNVISLLNMFGRFKNDIESKTVLNQNELDLSLEEISNSVDELVLNSKRSSRKLISSKEWIKKRLPFTPGYCLGDINFVKNHILFSNYYVEMFRNIFPMDLERVIKIYNQLTLINKRQELVDVINKLKEVIDYKKFIYYHRKAVSHLQKLLNVRIQVKDKKVSEFENGKTFVFKDLPLFRMKASLPNRSLKQHFIDFEEYLLETQNTVNSFKINLHQFINEYDSILNNEEYSATKMVKLMTPFTSDEENSISSQAVKSYYLLYFAKEWINNRLENLSHRKLELNSIVGVRTDLTKALEELSPITNYIKVFSKRLIHENQRMKETGNSLNLNVYLLNSLARIKEMTRDTNYNQLVEVVIQRMKDFEKALTKKENSKLSLLSCFGFDC